MDRVVRIQSILYWSDTNESFNDRGAPLSSQGIFGVDDIKLEPKEEELVQIEVLRLWTTRMRMASRTSWMGYGALFFLLWDTVDFKFLGTWVAVFVALESAHIVLASKLLRSLTVPTQRQKLLRILSLSLFPMGVLWGLVPLMPGVEESDGLYMVSLLFIAVVALFSVHNLCVIRRTLATFTVGIAIPVFAMGASSPLEFHQLVAVSALVFLVLLQHYGKKAHELILHDIRSGVLTRKLSMDLSRTNDELTDALKRVQELARLDSLTKCLNRRAMMEILDQEAIRNDRYGVSFGLVMLDLDHFKSINDTHGHSTGDAVLVETANRLRARMRTSDSLARWGGEEFLCLLMHVDQATLVKKAQDLCDALGGTPLLESPVVLTVTGSFGVALCESKQPIQEVIDSADQALYRAKRSGRNRVCI